MNIADRSGPTVSGEPQENMSPVFPYYYGRNNGYISIGVGVGGNPVEIAFVWNRGTTADGQTNWNLGDWETLLLANDARKIIVMPRVMLTFTDGWDQPYTGEFDMFDDAEFRYHANATYRLRIAIPDATTINFSIYNANGTLPIRSASVDLTGLVTFSGTEIFRAGWPSTEHHTALSGHNAPPPYITRRHDLEGLKLLYANEVV